MYADNSPDQKSGATAFRVAEKRYQLCKEQLFSFKKGKRRSKGYCVRPVDLSDVLILEPTIEWPGTSQITLPLTCMPPTAAAWTFARHPGLLLVRGALGTGLQRQLITEAFTRFCEPPNHTNHSKCHPGGLPGLWDAAQRGLRLQQGGSAGAGSMWGTEGTGPTADSLLRRLRWSTIGPPYDWTLRQYLLDVPHTPLPTQLRQLAQHLASLAATMLGQQVEPSSVQQQPPSSLQQAQPPQQEGLQLGSQHLAEHQQQQQQQQQVSGQQQSAAYKPDAALVNYYREGDTLNGHIDDAENSLEQPLVSLSLGCDAIFLIGGPTKDVHPTALLLRSGDVLVLAGPARHCYHGVPRVLTDRPLPAALACSGRGPDACPAGGQLDQVREPHDGEADPFEPFARHMRSCRINISIRDTR